MDPVKHQHLPMPQITNASRSVVQAKYNENFHADADDEIVHVISGKVCIRLENGEEYTAGQNETLLIPRGMRHRDIFELKTGLEVFLIHFRWRASAKLFAHTLPDCLKNLNPKDKNELILLLDMFRLDTYRTPADLTIGEGRLAHLLGIIWRHVFASENEHPGSDTYSRLAAYAHVYMTAHMAEAITLDTVAAYCKVSRATLLRAFRHASSMSFNGCLRAIRMNEAYSLLKERGLNVAECAKRCGFGDAAYFSRVFKKHFGFSPKNII